MVNDNRKIKHSYRLSYYDTCGDSIDPDLEDIEQWENELREGASLPDVLTPLNVLRFSVLQNLCLKKQKKNI